MEIALFGTSADPPTQGHQTILAGLVQRYDHVAVWASDNPFKQHGASLGQRSEMLQLAVNALQTRRSPEQSMEWLSASGQGSMAVHPELSSPRSLITVQRAQQLWPQANFTLVIGSDLVPQVPSWYAAETLLAQVKLLVVPRPGYPLDEEALHWLRDRTTVNIAPFQGPPISSSDYRHRHRPVVHPTVQAYIQRENLYPCPDALLETRH